MIRTISLLLTFFIASAVFAQDTLPKFSVRNMGRNRIIVGWINPFSDIKQLSVQRSEDSVKNYKTIMSMADPRAVQNGFADTKAPHDSMYYRIFYVLEGGRFYFTAAKRPFRDTTRRVVTPPKKNGVVTPPLNNEVPDTTAIAQDTVVITVKKPVSFVPSFYVYTNRDGYVYINLPDAASKKYSIKFFEEDESFLFEISNIRQTALTLDKANFLHGGWFHFELYNNGQLVERHRFYLPRDFNP